MSYEYYADMSVIFAELISLRKHLESAGYQSVTSSNPSSISLRFPDSSSASTAWQSDMEVSAHRGLAVVFYSGTAQQMQSSVELIQSCFESLGRRVSLEEA